jgi:serine/threonine protein kinase
VLLALRSLDGLTEDQVLDLLGEPYQATIYLTTKDAPNAPINPKFASLPKYLVYPVDWRDVNPSDTLPKVRVTDFGQSFLTTNTPPPTKFGIPLNYRAPELTFQVSSSAAMDLWSLGCTLFEIRTGKRLFNIFPGLSGIDKSGYLEELAAILGRPPEPWWSLWPRRGDSVIEESGDSTYSKVNLRFRTTDMAWYQRAQSIREYVAFCHDCSDHQGQKCPETLHEIVPEEESGAMSDVIEKLVRYKPEERIAAQDVLDGEWLRVAQFDASALSAVVAY